MATSMLGEKAKVLLEFPDGRIVEMNAHMISLNYEPIDISTMDEPYKTYTPSHRGVEITLQGSGPPVFDAVSHEEFNEKRRTASEWQCSFCDRPNKRENETCESCGATRSFLYG